MKKEDIIQCFDNMKKINKGTMKWLPIVGIILIAIGGIMYALVSGKDAIIISYLIMGLGAFCILFLLPIIYFGSKSTANKIEKVSTILATEPKKLVWSYIYQVTRNNVKSEFIIMKFKDGEEIEVHKSAIKNNTLEDFLYALKANYNSDMTLGFSEELKQKYLNGQL
jgi:hypothetical protein